MFRKRIKFVCPDDQADQVSAREKVWRVWGRMARIDENRVFGKKSVSGSDESSQDVLSPDWLKTNVM